MMRDTYRFAPSERAETDVTMEALLYELRSGSTDEGDSRLAVASESEGPSEAERLVGDVLDGLFSSQRFRFSEPRVKESLAELLLVLVGLTHGGASGKALMDDLSRVFDARLSPGTVYPRLHDLEAEGYLRAHEMVRTKDYHLDDAAAVRERVSGAMYQHLALGVVLYAALEEL